MKGVLAVLLIGVLSMLFAEVFSGASQMWYIEIMSILLTLLLYLGHVVFLLYIALKKEKTSIPQLYILGMLFGLYEALITKVLWAGYIDSAGPSFGTFLGISTMEFPILVLFWHPVMSFIIPVLVFQILSKSSLSTHKSILGKTKLKSILGIVFAAAFATFIANGNGFDILSANLSIIGTVLIGLILAIIVKPKNIKEVELSKKGFVVSIVYLVFLYLLSFFWLLPERIPTTFLPYISIIILYSIFILMFIKSKKVKMRIIKLTEKEYSTKDVIYFLILIVIFTNIACLIPPFAGAVLIASYLTFIIIGIILFLITLINVVKKKY